MKIDNECKIKDSKNIAIALYIVFPEDTKDKINNLLSQIELTVNYLSNFQNQLQNLMLSNNINLLKKCSLYKRYETDNIYLFNLGNNELTISKKEINKMFRYVFPKIDYLAAIKNYFQEKNFSHLISSYINSIFLDINYLLEYTKGLQTISAIDYYPEHYFKKGFQKIMENLISSLLPGSFYLKDKKIK